MYKEINTNQIAYCIEPFRFFKENSNYESSININNLSPEKIDTIKRLAYYGYGYDNHQELKWYAITQYLIWQETVQNGEIYFTYTPNGNKVYPFQTEIQELYNLVNNSRLKPSFINQTHYTTENNNLILTDTNNVLKDYKTNNYIINDNNLIINNLKEGSYSINLTKSYNKYNNPLVFYESPNSQNLVKLGNIEDENIKINIEVLKTNITINKIDYDTKNIYPQGESSLDNAIIGLYDTNMNLIKEYKITNNKINIENINFGKYYIKEITPGTGYNLNENIYEININKDNYDQIITIENKVIKKKIIIEKKYGEENNLNYEKNITFEIYNKDNQLINTIETNELGIAEIILPYGNYQIKQLNTTTGYQKIEPFIINITNNDEEIIKLTDYKIKVPNTKKDSYILKIILLLLDLLI